MKSDKAELVVGKSSACLQALWALREFKRTVGDVDEFHKALVMADKTKREIRKVQRWAKLALEEKQSGMVGKRER